MRKRNWRKYGIEFLSIFVAVIAAFALNNWNDNRKDANAASKIITEISNGLRKDIDDIRMNKYGNEMGVKACRYWRNIIENKEVNPDSISIYYFSLTRDFISIQNVSGYETLKSRGLELLENDGLRAEIISLYEYDYNILRKLEEEYHEMQFQENYFKEINSYLAPHFTFDESGSMVKIDQPLALSDSEKKVLLTYLWKIERNRDFILMFYADIENKVNDVLNKMEAEND